MQHDRRHSSALAIRRPAAALLAAAVAASTALVAMGPATVEPADRRVIVTGIAGATADVADLVASVGGQVLAELPIIDGVVAEVSSAALATLRSAPVVRSVADDAPIASHSTTEATTTETSSTETTSTTETSTTDTSTTDTSTDTSTTDTTSDTSTTDTSTDTSTTDTTSDTSTTDTTSDTSTTDTTSDTSTTDTSTTEEEAATEPVAPTPPAPVYTGFDAATNPGSLALLNRDVIGAGAYWDAGFTGAGVDVAIIDTGTAPVPGLDAGQVLHGPDLSFDSQIPEWTHTDGFGHGTHISAIIAGREGINGTAPSSSDTSNFLGVAPGSRLVSVKMGDHGGAADVSQAIAAIDWVVSNRDKHGLNIRVLNLSFGYDSTNPYTSDPLAYAAGQAWRKGIVVVAAAGNGGSKTKLSSPAYNPHILAVGATDSMMTTTTTDDVIPTWSSCDSIRNPDVVAPGRSIVSLRVPGSYVDSTASSSKVTDYLSRGSGTSQSAGFVSGAAALIISQRPSITPDGVRALLTSTASSIQKAAPKKCQGSGVINLRRALVTPTPSGPLPTSYQAASTGTGSLNAARGGLHIVDLALPEGHPDRVLAGEKDIFGKAWNGSVWAPAMAAGSSWSADGSWNGSQWTGSQWTGSQWTGSQWTGSQWTGSQWTGSQWTNAWSGSQWTGSQWTGSQWTGSQWTGSQWTGSQWTGSQWTGSQWTGSQWTGSQWTGSQWTGSQWTGSQWTGFLSARWE